MDQDQANHRFLTDGSYLVLTPRFYFLPIRKRSHTCRMLIETDLEFIYLTLKQDSKKYVGEISMTFAPRFSPDGNKIVMSYTDPNVGNSEIYILDLKTRISNRVTNNSSIDVSASFSPDGNKIVFNSDRSW